MAVSVTSTVAVTVTSTVAVTVTSTVAVSMTSAVRMSFLGWQINDVLFENFVFLNLVGRSGIFKGRVVIVRVSLVARAESDQGRKAEKKSDR